MKNHPDLYTKDVQRRAERQIEAYAPERNGYFFQYEGEARNTYSGAVISLRSNCSVNLTVRRSLACVVLESYRLLAPLRSGLCGPGDSLELSSLILNLSTEERFLLPLWQRLALTNGSRVSELLQVSSSRFETIVVDEMKNQQPTGRKMGILVQKLLPKGYQHESERQFFLISDMAVRHLKEIAEMLQATHSGRIPIVYPEAFGNKADDLVAEPYFFQWAASPDGRLGHFNAQDVAQSAAFSFPWPDSHYQSR